MSAFLYHPRHPCRVVPATKPPPPRSRALAGRIVCRARGAGPGEARRETPHTTDQSTASGQRRLRASGEESGSREEADGKVGLVGDGRRSGWREKQNPVASGRTHEAAPAAGSRRLDGRRRRASSVPKRGEHGRSAVSRGGRGSRRRRRRRGRKAGEAGRAARRERTQPGLVVVVVVSLVRDSRGAPPRLGSQLGSYGGSRCAGGEGCVCLGARHGERKGGRK